MENKHAKCQGNTHIQKEIVPIHQLYKTAPSDIMLAVNVRQFPCGAKIHVMGVNCLIKPNK